MNQREKLIELLNETFEQQYEKRGILTADRTADFLLANGVIVPPCKVGDTVYRITKLFLEETKIVEGEVFEIAITNEHGNKVKNSFYFYEKGDTLVRMGYSLWCDFDEFGKTVFLSREEAEAELNKRGATNAKNN